MVKAYVLTPLTQASFRWFGTSALGARGPMTYMRSEPLPLPTTLAGALYSALGGKGRDGAVSLEELDRLLGEVSGCGVGRFWGPYLLIHELGEPSHWVALCAHSLGGGLSCFVRGPRGGVLKIDRMEMKRIVRSSVGIALDGEKKVVIEGMIYGQSSVDYRALAALIGDAAKVGGPLEASVVAEFRGCDPAEPVLDVVPFGGDGMLARVGLIDLGASPLEAFTGEGSPYHYLVVSPILLKGAGPGFGVNAAEAARGLADAVGLSPGDVVLGETLVVVAPSPTGYDISANAPRPLVPAIMPGSVITANSVINVEPGPLGFGTIMQIGHTEYRSLFGVR